MTFIRNLMRYITLTVSFVAILTWTASAQVAEKLTTPEWKEFKASIAEFDMIMHAMQKLQDENPEAANDPMKMQELLGDKMTRFYELYQTIPQKLPSDLKDITEFDDYGIDELRVLKYATTIAQNFSSALDVNLSLVQLVKDPDSIRSMSAESAQFAVFADRLELAEGMLKDGALDSAEHMQRVMLFNSMSGAYAGRKDPERAREYSLLAMKSSGEALRSARTGLNKDQYPQIEAYLAQQTGSSAAEILYVLKEAGDAHVLEQYRQLLMKALAEENAWPAFERAMNEQLTRIEKDKSALNQPAAEWKEHQWIGSKPLSLAALKGKVVLVDFFRYLVPSVHHGLSYLKQWQEKYEAKGLVIVGLTNYQGRYDGASQKPEEEFAKLRDDFIPKHSITWPVGVEKGGRQTMLDYEVQGIPHVVLIDRQGKIQYVKVGASDYDKTERKIQELLAQ